MCLGHSTEVVCPLALPTCLQAEAYLQIHLPVLPWARTTSRGCLLILSDCPQPMPPPPDTFPECSFLTSRLFSLFCGILCTSSQCHCCHFLVESLITDLLLSRLRGPFLELREVYPNPRHRLHAERGSESAPKKSWVNKVQEDGIIVPSPQTKKWRVMDAWQCVLWPLWVKRWCLGQRPKWATPGILLAVDPVVPRGTGAWGVLEATPLGALASSPRSRVVLGWRSCVSWCHRWAVFSASRQVWGRWHNDLGGRVSTLDWFQMTGLTWARLGPQTEGGKLCQLL